LSKKISNDTIGAERSGFMISMEERRAKIKKNVWESFISSILFIIFALVLLLKEEDIISTLVLIVGFFGLVLGSIHLLMYYRMEKPLRVYSNDVFGGLVMILFGGIAILKNEILANMLTYVIGAYLIYKNANRLQMILHLDEENTSYWKYLAGLSIGCIFLGCLIVLNPFETIAISVIIAVCVIASEVINLIQNVCILIGLGRKNGAE